MFFVRTASQRDLEPVRALLAASWHATYDAVYGVEKVDAIVADWHAPEKLAERLARIDGEFLVADDGKRIGGMAFAAPVKGKPETLQLHQLYVHPDFQGQGIGADLFAEIETCFPHAKRLMLEVEPDNARAIAFYIAKGMTESGRTGNCGAAGSGIEAIILEKDLPQN